MFLLVSVCCDTAEALVFLLVSVCCDTARAKEPLLVDSGIAAALRTYPGSLMNLMKSESDPFLWRKVMHVRCEMCLKARKITFRACAPAKKRTLLALKMCPIHDIKYGDMT